MAPKIIAAVLILIANLAAGIVIFFAMLLAMNGFHESDAIWGLIAYIVLSILIAILMSLGAVAAVGAMTRKRLPSYAAVLISVPVFTILGIGLEIVSSLIGVGVAEFVRVNY